MSGSFEQRFGLCIGGTTEEFTLSPEAAAGSLSRIFDEAHKEAVRTNADVLCLMLRRPMASLNEHLDLEQWDSIFAVTQTRKRTAIAILPFRRTDLGLEFEELDASECESESFATPQVIFEKLGYVVDGGKVDGVGKKRDFGKKWN